MKALTVKQPWAWAIIHGGKNIENRTWRTATDLPIRIAIHAAKTLDKNAFNRVLVERREKDGPDADLIRGAIIGTVNLVRIGREPNSPWAMPHSDLWHWRLAHPVKLPEPIPCRGALGLWTVPEELGLG